MQFRHARAQPSSDSDAVSGVHRIGTAPRDVVLLVEPDADVRRALVKALAVRFHVLDAPEALSAAELLGGSERPHAVVVSASLPVINGPTFVRKLRSLREYAIVPIIFLTTRQDVRQLTQAIAAGARACLEKPVDPDRVCARLVRLLGRWEE
jgi:DNA-binding response OmpR family regulator